MRIFFNFFRYHLALLFCYAFKWLLFISTLPPLAHFINVSIHTAPIISTTARQFSLFCPESVCLCLCAFFLLLLYTKWEIYERTLCTYICMYMWMYCHLYVSFYMTKENTQLVLHTHTHNTNLLVHSNGCVWVYVAKFFLRVKDILVLPDYLRLAVCLIWCRNLY